LSLLQKQENDNDVELRTVFIANSCFYRIPSHWCTWL